MAPVPIVLIGRTPAIALEVKKGLLPEYEAIHIIYTEDQAIKELPYLLSTPPRKPPNSDSNDGTRNYGVPKVLAVAAGGGFDNQQFQQVRDSCKDVEQGVIWVRGDMSKLSTMPPPSDPAAFGLETAKRAKKTLDDARGQGIDSGVFFYT